MANLPSQAAAFAATATVDTSGLEILSNLALAQPPMPTASSSFEVGASIVGEPLATRSTAAASPTKKRRLETSAVTAETIATDALETSKENAQLKATVQQQQAMLDALKMGLADRTTVDQMQFSFQAAFNQFFPALAASLNGQVHGLEATNKMQGAVALTAKETGEINEKLNLQLAAYSTQSTHSTQMQQLTLDALSAQREEMGRLAAQLQDLEKILLTHQRGVESASSETALALTSSAQQANIIALNEQIQTLKLLVQRQEQTHVIEVDQLKSRIRELELQLAQLSDNEKLQTIVTLNMTVAGYDLKLNQSNANLEQVTRELKEINGEVNELKDLNADLNRQNLDLQQRVDELEALAARYKSERNDGREQLTQAIERGNSYKARGDAYKKQVMNLKATVEPVVLAIDNVDSTSATVSRFLPPLSSYTPSRAVNGSSTPGDKFVHRTITDSRTVITRKLTTPN